MLIGILLMPFGSAEVDAEVLYVAGDDEDAFGLASSATAEAKPNTIVLKVVSQYGTEGVLRRMCPPLYTLMQSHPRSGVLPR